LEHHEREKNNKNIISGGGGEYDFLEQYKTSVRVKRKNFIFGSCWEKILFQLTTLNPKAFLICF
jgi:hypothetical protein